MDTGIIKSVKLFLPDEEAEGINAGAKPFFEIVWDDDTVSQAPADAPLNRHYQEVKEWHSKQKNKPFVFEFE